MNKMRKTLFLIMLLSIIFYSSSIAQTPLVPSNGATSVELPVPLSWSSGGATGWKVQVGLDPAFSTVVFSTNVTTFQTALATGLDENTQYYWRVRGYFFNGLVWWPLGYGSTSTFTTRTYDQKIWLSSITGGSLVDKTIVAGVPVTFNFTLKHSSSPLNIIGLSNGLKVYSSNGATWSGLTGSFNTDIDWNGIFDGGQFISPVDVDGSGVDTVGFGAFSMFAPGLPSGSELESFVLEFQVDLSSVGKTLCVDSSFYPPSNTWFWATSTGSIVPGFLGPYCFDIVATCCLNRGNVDDIIGPAGPVDVSDLTYIVEFLFKGGPVPPCIEQGNVDGIVGPAGPIDVSDLTYLVEFLFKGGPIPPGC